MLVGTQSRFWETLVGEVECLPLTDFYTSHEKRHKRLSRRTKCRTCEKDIGERMCTRHTSDVDKTSPVRAIQGEAALPSDGLECDIEKNKEQGSDKGRASVRLTFRMFFILTDLGPSEDRGSRLKEHRMKP